MTAARITETTLARQEETFVHTFTAGDLEIARPLYHPDVVYLSPTVRLFGWPERIEGIDATLEFIGLTIRGLDDVSYQAVEMAALSGGSSAFVRVHFDWNLANQRLRSNYVVLYRYRDGLIGQQELYYDPSGKLEVIAPAS